MPIIIGYPNLEDFEAAEAGHVILQGCIVFGDEPRQGVACTQCEWFGERLPGNKIREIARPQAFSNHDIFDLEDLEPDPNDPKSR